MDETVSSRSDRDVKALRHGLKILDLVARSDRPLSATTIGVEIGLHQTSVSRILNTLSAEGYVRKARPRGYIASLGVFSLSSAAIQQFPLTKKADPILRAAIEEFPDFSVALATIWRGELMNFGCPGAGQSIALLSAPRSPLHLSAAGLRLLIDFPRQEAINLLTESCARFGSPKPSSAAPTAPEAILELAQANTNRSTLVTVDWQSIGHISGAINVELLDSPPFALEMSGCSSRISEHDLRMLLYEMRRRLERLLGKGERYRD